MDTVVRRMVSSCAAAAVAVACLIGIDGQGGINGQAIQADVPAVTSSAPAAAPVVPAAPVVSAAPVVPAAHVVPAATAPARGPIAAADLDAAAARVRSAIAAIPESRKAAPADVPEAAPAIDWESLSRQASNPAEADPAVLRKLERAIRSQSQGFDPPLHRSLADAVRRYGRLVGASRNPSFEAEVGKQVADLEAMLDKAEAIGKDADAGFAGLEKAAATLESLDDTRQAAAVLAKTRRLVGRPNVFVEARESLLAQAAGRPIDEVAPVDEVILGIRQRGSGHTRGFVMLDLVPSLDSAAIDLVLDATNHANTRGGRGPVTVCSRGTTDLDARRRIHLDEEQLWGLPVEAKASTHSETEGIGVRAHLGRNLIRNIASRQAASMRPQADAISAGRARDRLRDRFDSQTRDAIDRLATGYRTQFRDPLVLHDLYPEMLHHNTTDDAIHSAARKMLAGQIGAATSPPPPANGAVLSARVHQTAIANAASSWLAGRTFTKEQVEAEYRRRNRPLPESLTKDVDDASDDDGAGQGGARNDANKDAAKPPKPWSIRFAAQRPVELQVEDDRVTATLRGDSFTSGDKTVGPMEVKATYRIESSPAGSRLVREGDIVIAPPGGKWEGDREKPTPTERVIRLRLKRRLEQILTKSIDVGSLTLPGQLESAGPLPVHHLSSRKDGWINVGWRKKDPVIYESSPAPVVEPVPGSEVIAPGFETSAAVSR